MYVYIYIHILYTYVGMFENVKWKDTYLVSKEVGR